MMVRQLHLATGNPEKYRHPTPYSFWDIQEIAWKKTLKGQGHNIKVISKSHHDVDSQTPKAITQ